MGYGTRPPVGIGAGGSRQGGVGEGLGPALIVSSAGRAATEGDES